MATESVSETGDFVNTKVACGVAGIAEENKTPVTTSSLASESSGDTWRMRFVPLTKKGARKMASFIKVWSSCGEIPERPLNTQSPPKKKKRMCPLYLEHMLENNTSEGT